MRRRTVANASRLRTRYPAKKIVSAILASSEGWNDNGPSRIHNRAPLMLVPITGSRGSNRSTTPATRLVKV